MLISVMLIAAIPTEAEAAIYEDTVRLHILANSDSAEDQELKIKLRDKILEKYGAELKTADGASEAKERLSDLLPEIEEFAGAAVHDLGYDYTVSAELTEEWYDTRDYKDFTLPAGRYTSLKIEIGKARGQNWWCVMFPPLCLDIASEDAPPDDGFIDYTKEELVLIQTEKYNVKFKILELLSDVFG